MTYRDLLKKIAEIRSEKFAGNVNDPIAFARDRAAFKQKKLRRMIALAEGSKLATFARKKLIWQRMLAKAEATESHFAKQLKMNRPALPLSTRLLKAQLISHHGNSDVVARFAEG